MTSSSSTVVNLGTLQSDEIGTISGAVATDGFIEYSFHCKHHLAGQKLELPELKNKSNL